MVSKRFATIQDIEYIASKMRSEDVEEVWALSRANGQDALIESFYASSECWVGENNGNMFCVLGCVPCDDGATLWMIFTQDVQYLPISFFKQSKEHLKEMLATYGKLSNYTQQSNVFILKWLKWLGFNVEPLSHIGIDNIPAHVYWKERC